MSDILIEEKINKVRNWKNYSSEVLDSNKKSFLIQETKRLRQHFANNYFKINNSHIQKQKTIINQFLKEKRINLVVPMKETQDTIKNLLCYATKKMPPESIIVINDNSSQKAVKAVKKFQGVNLINKEEILNLLDWKKLNSLIHLKQKSKGKGMSVMAGYLFLYIYNHFKNKNQGFIFQTDADIKNHTKFKPLEYLTYGILQNCQTVYVKIAKGGRNNESHIAVRSALAMLEDLNLVIEGEKANQISQRAKQLFENLAKYKWILGGTFALSEKLAFSRPFASGYLEETLICAFIEDWIKKNNGVSIQISNPNYCSDGDNSYFKENTIVQTTANFVITLTLMEKMIPDWTLEDIAWLNKNLMSKPKPIALIPPKKSKEPVFVQMIGSEKILPSIKILDNHNLINWHKAEQFLKVKNLI